MTHKDRMLAALGLDEVVKEQYLAADGINVYPLLRLSLFIHLIREDYSYKHTKGKRRREFFTSVIKFYSNGYFRLRSNRKKVDTILLSYSTFRRTAITGKWYDLYADSYVINKELNNYRYIEIPQRGIYRKDRYSDSVYLNPLVQLKGIIYGRFKPVCIEGDEWRIAIQYCNSLGYNISKAAIERKVAELKYYKNYFVNHFFNREIERVICTSFSMNFSMAIMWAANERGLSTYELQHGSIYSDSPYYCHWSGVDSPLLPKVCLVWTEDQAKYINNTNVGFPRAEVDGNGFLNALKSGAFNFSEYDSLWQRYCSNQRVVLIALQRDDLPSWLILKLNKLIDQGWAILLRPHPGLNNSSVVSNLPNIASLLMEKNVYLMEFESLPLFYLLSKIEFLIAGKSTTLIEASLFSKRSVIVVEDGLEYFQSQIDKGTVLIGYNDELFERAIAEIT